MQFVKKLTGSAPGTHLRYYLHKHMVGGRPGRSVRTVHASDLMKGAAFCGRERVLMHLTGKKLPAERWTTSMRMTYDIGIMVHERVVHTFADMGMAVGNWQCQGCKSKALLCRRPKICEVCGCTAFRHREIAVQSPATGIVGGLDLLVDMGVSKLQLVEIKSIDKEQFKALVAPLAEHRWRTKLYLRLIDEARIHFSFANQIRVDQAKVLYVSKGGYGVKDTAPPKWVSGDGAFSPFKEYTVERDDAETDALVAQGANVYSFFVLEEGVPPGICSDANCERAHRCPVAGDCFSKKYPVGKYGKTIAEEYAYEPDSGSVGDWGY